MNYQKYNHGLRVPQPLPLQLTTVLVVLPLTVVVSVCPRFFLIFPLSLPCATFLQSSSRPPTKPSVFLLVSWCVSSCVCVCVCTCVLICVQLSVYLVYVRG